MTDETRNQMTKIASSIATDQSTKLLQRATGVPLNSVTSAVDAVENYKDAVEKSGTVEGGVSGAMAGLGAGGLLATVATGGLALPIIGAIAGWKIFGPR